MSVWDNVGYGKVLKMCKDLYSVATSCEINRNSQFSPIVQKTTPSSCFYFCRSCPRHIWPISRLNTQMWSVVMHVGSLGVQFHFSLCENKPHHRGEKLQMKKKSSTDLDQSKQTIGVKTPKKQEGM